MSDTADLHGYFFEDLAEGMTAVISKTVTDADVALFAGVSMDTNPLHLDEEFARSTRFGGRIAHGMLGASLISAVIGTRLPGPGAVYVAQTLRFRAPVRVGDTLRARVTVTALKPEKKRAELATVVLVGETVVIEGEATLMVPSRA